MVHPGGLLGCASPFGPLLKQRYPPWCLRLTRRPCNNSIAVISENMVHPGGFEPPTARFVAEYSIQLSYGCIRVLLSEIVNGASGRIRTSDRSVRSRVLYPAELRMHRDLLLYCSMFISLLKQYEVIDGASGRIRTSDRSVRSRVLYPAELRMQNGGEAGIRTPDAAFDRILP